MKQKKKKNINREREKIDEYSVAVAAPVEKESMNKSYWL